VMGSLVLLRRLRQEGRLSQEDFDRFIRLLRDGNEEMQTFYDAFSDSPDDYLDNISSWEWKA